MPYVNGDGTVSDRRSPWRISIISDAFWAVANFVTLFFRTLIDPTARPVPPRDGGGNRNSAARTSNYQRDRPNDNAPRPRGGANIRGLPKASECAGGG